MIKSGVSLIALLLLCFIPVCALAQDNKPPFKKPAPVSWNLGREPKNEVEQQLAAAASRGEIILGSCLEDCGEEPEDDLPAGFERGRMIELPKPAYPAIARVARAQGTVEVQVIIDVDGKVIAAVVVSGHPLLRAASMQAARSSVFTPTKWEGQFVKVVGVIRYNFVVM